MENNQSYQTNKQPTQNEGESIVVDLTKVKSVTEGCNHVFDIDYKKREVVCKKCGYGYIFHVHQVEMKEGKLYHKKLDKYIT